MKNTADRVRRVIRKLNREYPEARCSLNHENPLQLLVSTILSAQCTDERVNLVTKNLFKKYRTAENYADADPDALAEMIRSTGFFRNKTKSLIGMGQALVDHHGGEVPRTMEELTKVPGVGRKTANVVLGNAFGIDEGVVVDTHVARISKRLRFTKKDGPEKIERDLMKLVPKKDWTLFPHLMIYHGRATCQARKPKCEICVIKADCPFPRRTDGKTDRQKTGKPRRTRS